ncbi:hypothetical protein DFAR_2120001 [Desulfarculales bacterium]
MLKAREKQLNTTGAQKLGFEERRGLMADREAIHRENRWLKNRLAKAKLRHDAYLKDIDYRQRSGVDKSLIMACPHADGSLNTTICSSADPPA